MENHTALTVWPAYLAGFRCERPDCPLGRTAADAPCPALRDIRIHAVCERSLRLDCPRAAHYVLAAPESFHFESQRLPAAALSPANRQLASLAEPRPEHAFLLDLQRTSLRLLKAQAYPLDARLVLLGIYLEDAVAYIEDGRGYKLGELVKSYASPLFAARFHEALKNIAFEPLAHLDFLIGILKELTDTQDLALDAADLALVRRAYRLDGPPDLDRVRRTYALNRRAFERAALTLPHFPERLLLHQFYTELYPCAVPGGIIHNYWLFVLSCKLAELLLTAHAALERQQLTTAHLAEAIAKTARLPQTRSGLSVLERTLDGREDDSLRLFRLLYHIPQMKN